MTAKFWAAEFKRGCESLGDDERSGRPKTATADENIVKIHQMVPDDRRIKVREIAEVMNMSKERVCHINIWAWESCPRVGCRVCSR